MTLSLHNTLTKQLEPFAPQLDRHVTLYTCGPTVYDRPHIGNWVAFIYWDILVRTLLANEYNVTRVMNITDVGHLTSDADDGEDKLEKGARREGKTAWDVAKLYGDYFVNSMEHTLGFVMPEHITKATDFIPQQLDLVRTLKERGFVYQISDGLYFDTSKFPTYADFAGLDVAAQKAGARVEFNTEKRTVSDFALWKFTPAGETRDMEWETPADLLEGDAPHMGFPGWHLECSAMAMSILGNTIDIHTGGIDHIPVHHTNEIAQSEAASGQLFARFWIHNNHLKVEGTKISKSLGNGYTLEELAKRGYSAMDYRMFVLQSHYRTEGNFTFDNLGAAQNRLQRWRSIATLRHQTHDTLQDDDARIDDDRTVSLLATSGALVEAINNDLNTPDVLRIVDEAFDRIAAAPLDRIHRHGLVHALETIDQLLGLQLVESTPDISDDMKQLILRRDHARAEKDWQASDQLRDQLLREGIEIRDTQHGAIWHYANS